MPTFTAPLATITLQVSGTIPLITDIQAAWKLAMPVTTGTPPVLVNTVATTDTSIVVSKLAVTLAQQGASNWYANAQQPTTAIQVGSVLNVDGEEMTVTAIAGPDASNNNAYTLTVSRGTTQTNAAGVQTSYPFANPTTHAIGASVAILLYASPWEMANQQALLPWAMNLQKALGPLSAVFQTTASGSVSLTSS